MTAPMSPNETEWHPAGAWHSVAFERCTVRSVTMPIGDPADSPFRVPSWDRNLVGTRDRTQLWAVDAPPESADDGKLFEDVYNLDGRCVADGDEYFYEISLEDGTIEASWPRSTVRTPAGTVELDFRVKELATFDDLYIAKGATFFAAIRGEDVVWERPTLGLSLLSKDLEVEGLIPLGGSFPKGRALPIVGLDPETGHVVEPIAGPLDHVEEHLEFDHIDDPVVHDHTPEVVVFGPDGERYWTKRFDASTLSACRWNGRTVVCYAADEEELRHIQIINDDGTVQQRFEFPEAVSVERGDPYPVLVVEDSEEEHSYEFDPETGQYRRLDAPESATWTGTLESDE